MVPLSNTIRGYRPDLRTVRILVADILENLGRYDESSQMRELISRQYDDDPA